MILAGDVGGTKTALGLYREETGPENPLVERVFSSQEHSSLEELTASFLNRENPGAISSACFAVAGPVISGRASVTNLPWTVRDETLSAALNTDRLKMINDVQAVACAVPILKEDDLRTLNTGRPKKNGTVAVIAVGTGLGEAFLTWDGNSYISHPTEGGHADFAPGDKYQAELLAFIGRKRDHVSWETVCSGIGIPNIYDYLASTRRHSSSGIGSGHLSSHTDRTPAIIGAALGQPSPDPLCAETLNMFVSILGAESGNLALKTMATGGVYVGGGIPPRVLKVFETDFFLNAFNAKGRLTSMMEGIPVHIILNPRAALIGAAAEAFRMNRK